MSFRNKCQNCYCRVARYIKDCLCLVCQVCEPSTAKGPVCPLCKKSTKHCKVETTNKQQMASFSHLFSNIDVQLTKSIEVCRFQTEQSQKYISFLQVKNRLLEQTLNELLRKTPQLASLVHARAPFIQFFRTQKSYSQNAMMPTRAFDKSGRANSERQSFNRLFKVPNLNAETAGSNRRREEPYQNNRKAYY